MTVCTCLVIPGPIEMAFCLKSVHGVKQEQCTGLWVGFCGCVLVGFLPSPSRPPPLCPSEREC